MMMKIRPLLPLIGVVGAILIGLAFWYFQIRKAAPEIPGAIPREDASLGAQLFEKAANPVKGNLPETNPFEAAETNPIDTIYKNPFE